MEFKKLEDQAEFDEKVEPLYYVGMLMVAIIFTLMSLNMYYMIFLNLIQTLVSGFDGLDYNWFNLWASTADAGSVDLTFLINWVFIGLCLYALYAAVKGNEFYGYRSACITFFSMQ